MSGTRGCFRLGCVGCGMLVALIIALPFLLGGVGAALDALHEEPRPERVDRVHGLPPPAPPATSRPTEGEPQTVEAAPGEIVVDLALGELLIEPAAEDRLSLDARYDASRYELEEELDDSGPRWRYSVRLRKSGSWLDLLRLHGRDSRLELQVPPDHPFTLTAKVGAGRADIDLGGLQPVDVELELGAGEHRLGFSRRSTGELRRLDVDSGAGELQIVQLGNGSPRRARIRQAVGRLTLDLDGWWRGDAVVETSLGVGELKLHPPRSARMALDRVRIAVGTRDLHRLEGRPGDATEKPTVRLEASGGVVSIEAR